MKFSQLSTLALTISLAFGTTMPAQANVFELLLQKKQHHTHQRYHQNHRYSHSNHRVHYDGHHHNHHLNHRRRHSSSRKKVRVYNPHRRYGNLRHRH